MSLDKKTLKIINPKFTSLKTTQEIYASYHPDYLDRIEQYALIGWEFEVISKKPSTSYDRYNLAQLQKLPIRDLVLFLETYKETTTKPIQLIDRIL